MIPFRVKVCGITRPEDAAVAVTNGADLIGLIFYSRSPRRVSPDAAAAIITKLPPVVHRVGVFVDDPLDRVLATAARLDLDFLQLHGPYTDDDVRRARRVGFRTIRLRTVRRPSDYAAFYTDPADIVMVDHPSGALAGGTGTAFDWRIRPPVPIVNLMLAGGITADNLAEGVRTFQPLVVDVNSGVEEAPGVKSAEKMKRFFEVAN
ncbi:MAG TPA: phosphoribosylanthranilate isomerase, partial [candidate division Zixibacteria bacterium]|nr:phosphoribosylanthranilate isomerase [candidate division Zixibacteria bacterium]